DSLIADGMSTSTITLTLRDAAGDRIMDDVASVNMATTDGSIGPVSYAGEGRYQATLTSSTNVGFAVVTAELNGQPLVNSVTVVFTADPNAVDLNTSSVTADPTMLPADGTSTSELTVELRNSEGYLI